MRPLFVATILTSALLLFNVEPLIARLLLPLLGGTAAVWTACMLFFQTALLGGYLYAHLATKLFGVRRQAIGHLVLLALSLAALPIGLPAGARPDEAASPFLAALATLARSVGVPFFLLSANTPMLSRWYAEATRKDPYVLYSASNAGSLVALLGYPIVVEPLLPLSTQTRAWSVLYGLLAVLIGGCAIAVRRAPIQPANEPFAAVMAAPTNRDRGRWLVLAAVPSSLLLGVTTYLSTDVAPMPLLWVVPLALYLATFIVAFSPAGEAVHGRVLRYSVLVLIPLALVLAWRAALTPVFAVGLHLVTFLLVTLAVHGELARRRPSPAHLTEFYLWMSAGGVVGGLCNALIAPVIFTRPLEYPIALIAAAMLRPRAENAVFGRREQALDVVIPGVLFAILVALGRLPNTEIALFVVSIAGALASLRFSRRPLRFGLLLAALVFSGELRGGAERELTATRSFFGVHRVIIDAANRVIRLGNGTTTHGKEFADKTSPREPRGYYHRNGPLGSIMAVADVRTNLRVGVVGLGVGSSACYARPGDRFTFFEIDPGVVALAEDRRFFTSLTDCAPTARIVVGDARLSLADEPDGDFDVLILDAFSSDAVPAHLLTREAFSLYRQKLAPHGLAALHISNRFLNLAPVVAAGGAASGFVVAYFRDRSTPDEEAAVLHDPSIWTVLARDENDLGPIATDPRWQRALTKMNPWTDDFSNIASVLEWN